MEYKGLTLDPFQVDSITAIDNNHSVVVSAPTGSGKTLIADYIINRDIDKGTKLIYTAPIKALSNQKYKEFSTEYGKDRVGLLTGDVVINPEAQILIMTTEIYRNMALINDTALDNISYVVFDEIHFINDIERGYVWEESIIFSKDNVRFLCLSATIPNAKEFASWITKIKKHPVETVKCGVRNVPLHKYFYDTELGISTLQEIKDVVDIPQQRNARGRRGRAPRMKAPSHIELIKEIRNKLPCFFFNFSRQGCQDLAIELAQTKMFKINPEISAFVRKKLANSPQEINSLKSTRALRKTLPYGIAFHHAGLIPIIKEIVEELFAQGLINVLYTTETFAVGINMPAKTVCFKALRKFDGISFRPLNSKEYFQIAGRAGRRGIDKEGFVYAMVERRDFNFFQLKKLTDKDIDPIKSQFRLSVNTVLNLILRHTQEEIDVILKMSFHSYQRGRGEVKRAFLNIKKKLIALGYVEKGELTEKGMFSAKIYADEIMFGEIFATDFYEDLTEFQMLMIICALCYEGKERDKFYTKFPSKALHSLKKKISLKLPKDDRFRNLNRLSALMDPCFHGQDIFKIMNNTSLLEGDIIRLFRQIIDRIGQIRKATDDDKLSYMMKNCKEIIDKSLADIDKI